MLSRIFQGKSHQSYWFRISGHWGAIGTREKIQITMPTVYLAAISPSSCWNYSEKFKNTFAFSIVSKNWTIRTAKFFLHMRQCSPYLAHSKFRLLIACRRNGPWYWPRYFGIFGSWWRHQMETFPHYWSFVYGEFTGPRWIPRTKASGAELSCFLWSASE